MSSGIGVKLPLTMDEIDGAYKLNKTIADEVKQNLKNLILTNPGERILDPLFGVGIIKLLYEQESQLEYSDIKSRILQQVSKYMSFVDVSKIVFTGPSQNEEILENYLHVNIEYKIIPIDYEDALEIIQLVGEL